MVKYFSNYMLDILGQSPNLSQASLWAQMVGGRGGGISQLSVVPPQPPTFVVFVLIKVPK